jgi:hypothetical protein
MHAGTRYELGDVAFVLPAERARQFPAEHVSPPTITAEIAVPAELL